MLLFGACIHAQSRCFPGGLVILSLGSVSLVVLDVLELKSAILLFTVFWFSFPSLFSCLAVCIFKNILP